MNFIEKTVKNQEYGRKSARLTVGVMVYAIVLAAIMIASVRPGNWHLLELCLVLVEVVLPCYFILRLRHLKSPFEMLTIVIGLTYLVWGALFVFHPRSSGLFTDPWATIGLQLHQLVIKELDFDGVKVGFDDDVRRWNWGLLAILYAVLIGEAAALIARSGRPAGRHIGGEAGDVGFTKVYQLCWSRLGRFAIRVLALFPAIGAGLMLGLFVSTRRLPAFWWGWLVVGKSLFYLVIALKSMSIFPKIGKYRITFASILSVYWAFSLAVQLAEPRPLLGSGIISRAKTVPRPPLPPRGQSFLKPLWDILKEASDSNSLFP